MFFDPDGSRLHGLNERIRAKVLYDARDFMYDLIRIYAKEVSATVQAAAQCSFSRGRMMWLTWPTAISARPFSQP